MHLADWRLTDSQRIVDNIAVQDFALSIRSDLFFGEHREKDEDARQHAKEDFAKQLLVLIGTSLRTLPSKVIKPPGSSGSIDDCFGPQSLCGEKHSERSQDDVGRMADGNFSSFLHLVCHREGAKVRP